MPSLMPQSGTDTDPRVTLSPQQTRLLLLGLALATGMEFYTFDSMNLVLPDLIGTLGISRDEGSWILTVYSSFLFLGVPLSVWLAGHFGYKRFLLWTTGLFAATTIGCALSPTLGIMLVCRALQGLAGGGLVVWWRAGVYLLMEKPQRSPSLMKISTGLYLASVSGLLISGYVTDHIHWRFIFLPNVFMAVAAIALLRANFPDVFPKRSIRLQNTDCPGLFLLAIWILSLQIILSRGNIDDWFGSPHIRALALLSGTGLVAFVYWQLSPRNLFPLWDISLLATRNVLSSVCIGFFTGMILSGSLFVLPEYLRLVDSQTHSATQTGRLIAVYALAAAVLRPLVPGFVTKFGARKMIAFAGLMLILSMGILSYELTSGTPDGYLVLPLLLYALCLTPLLPSVGGGTVARTEQDRLLDGVSIYMTFRQLGASVGVALLSILIQQRETLHSSRLYEHLNQGQSHTAGWLGSTASYLFSYAGLDPFASRTTSVALLARTGAQQVDVLAYADCFRFMAVIGIVTFCLIPLAPPFVPAKKK